MKTDIISLALEHHSLLDGEIQSELSTLLTTRHFDPTLLETLITCPTPLKNEDKSSRYRVRLFPL